MSTTKLLANRYSVVWFTDTWQTMDEYLLIYYARNCPLTDCKSINQSLFAHKGVYLGLSA